MRNEKSVEKRTSEGFQRASGKPLGLRKNVYNQSEGFVMYRKVMLSLILLCLILLTLIAWKVGVFTAIAGLPFFPLVEKIVANTYFSGVVCSIISVVIIYKWQVWYSKRKLKQDFRCNECIEDIHDGIEAVCKYAPLLPEKEKGDEGSDFTELRIKNAQRYVDFYFKHKGDIYLGNLALSYEGNDLLIDSIQSCFFINLNFKLLEILNNVKNRLPNLRNKYPEIEDLEKKYKETHSEELMIQLGEKLATYFVDAKFMAGYWKELFDYLEYDPTFIKLFVTTYNARYKFEDDINLPVTVRSSHMLEVKREVKRAIIRDKIRNFWEK